MPPTAAPATLGSTVVMEYGVAIGEDMPMTVITLLSIIANYYIQE